MKKENNNNEIRYQNLYSRFQIPIVSVFENMYSTVPTNTVRLDQFLQSNEYEKIVNMYRNSPDENFRKKIKSSLVCITPSGVFKKRQESGIVRHTGLLCIDIDSKDNPTIDLRKSKHIIGQNCSSLFYAGLSLGGEGIFLIFRISNPEFHKQHFEALAYLLNEKFNLNVDRSVKSPVSLRVTSYDENPYYNPNVVPFQYTMETNNKSGHVIRTTTERYEILRHVKTAIAIIKMKRIDITNQYANWFKIGCALAHEFGEEGRHWFHMVSRIYKDYNEGDCDFQYDRCLKYKREDGTKIATFFYFCKLYGIEYWKTNFNS